MKKHCYFYFSGYYLTVAASNLLNRYRIPNRVIKAPVSAQKGCRFALVVDAEDAARSTTFLEKERVRYDSYEIISQ